MHPLAPEAVKHEIGRLLASCPELADDDDLRLDMLEGETNLHECLSMLVRRLGERDAQVAALKAYEAELSQRRARIDRQAKAIRATMQGLMDAADAAKVTLPEATVSITAARKRVVVDEADDLPQGFVLLVRKPVTAEISKALSAGEDVPGARLELGEPGLTVRRS